MVIITTFLGSSLFWILVYIIVEALKDHSKPESRHIVSCHKVDRAVEMWNKGEVTAEEFRAFMNMRKVNDEELDDEWANLQESQKNLTGKYRSLREYRDELECKANRDILAELRVFCEKLVHANSVTMINASTTFDWHSGSREAYRTVINKIDELSSKVPSVEVRKEGGINGQDS